MRLTPLDIRKQEFKRTMRGYDPDEVNTFLEMVAEEFEALLRDKGRLQEETTRLRTQLQDYQDVERTLKHALKSAQETAQQSLENSKRQADMVVRESEMQAEKILRDAKMRLADLKNDLLVVKAQKDSFARRLRHLLESQLELIGVLELDDLGFGEPEAPAASARTANRPATLLSSAAQGAELGRKLASNRTAASDDGAPPIRTEPSRITSPRGENIRRMNNRSATNSIPEIRPAAVETATPVSAKEQTMEDKKEPRISDHFIT